MPAEKLQLYDEVELSDGTHALIENLWHEKTGEEIPVYNMEVEDFHTYYIAKTGVLVHNDGGCGHSGGKVRISSKSGSTTVEDFIKNNVNPNFQQNVKEAFMNDAKVTVLEQDVTVYRYHGGSSQGTSYWYTPNQTSNPAADLALPQGNTYQYMDTFTIPKGTTILEGTVAPNFGQPGRGYQFYVPNPSVVIKQ